MRLARGRHAPSRGMAPLASDGPFLRAACWASVRRSGIQCERTGVYNGERSNTVPGNWQFRFQVARLFPEQRAVDRGLTIRVLRPRLNPPFFAPCIASGWRVRQSRADEME
jgi:hypothetical protein